MIILPMTRGRGKTRRIDYEIHATPAETGEHRHELVARFSDLESAALVLRFINGGTLRESDIIRALELMRPEEKKEAATTDQSNRDPKDD